VTITSYPAGCITPYGESVLHQGIAPLVAYRYADQVFNIMGGLAPVPGVQSGVLIQSINGVGPEWHLLDQSGARQDGVTNMGSVLEPIQMEMKLLVTGKEPGMTPRQAMERKRAVQRAWFAAWAADQIGEFSWTTPLMGKWWGMARWMKAANDDIPNGVNATQKFPWTARIDAGLWQSTPSTSQWPLAPLMTTSGSGWLPLANRGDRPGEFALLCYGPGTFGFSNGPGSATRITYGPLLDGQVVLLNSHPRLPTVVDLTQTTISHDLLPYQKALQNLVSFASNGNTVPFLQQFESKFGILPPQTNMAALLSGRFTNPMPAPTGVTPTTGNIAVSVTGANSHTKVIASLTPLRRYPE
jgi:hypothetical protein